MEWRSQWETESKLFLFPVSSITYQNQTKLKVMKHSIILIHLLIEFKLISTQFKEVVEFVYECPFVQNKCWLVTFFMKEPMKLRIPFFFWREVTPKRKTSLHFSENRRTSEGSLKSETKKNQMLSMYLILSALEQRSKGFHVRMKL